MVGAWEHWRGELGLLLVKVPEAAQLPGGPLGFVCLSLARWQGLSYLELGTLRGPQPAQPARRAEPAPGRGWGRGRGRGRAGQGRRPDMPWPRRGPWGQRPPWAGRLRAAG